MPDNVLRIISSMARSVYINFCKMTPAWRAMCGVSVVRAYERLESLDGAVSSVLSLLDLCLVPVKRDGALELL